MKILNPTPTATITHTLPFGRQVGLWRSICCQLAGHSSIELIKCKCISWGRKWGGVEGNHSLTRMHFSDQLGSIGEGSPS